MVVFQMYCTAAHTVQLSNNRPLDTTPLDSYFTGSKTDYETIINVTEALIKHQKQLLTFTRMTGYHVEFSVNRKK